MSNPDSDNSGGSANGITEGDRAANALDRNPRKHGLSSSDWNNDSSHRALNLVSDLLDEPHLKSRRKKVRVIKPQSKQLEEMLQAKGESAGAGSGNASEEPSTEPPSERQQGTIDNQQQATEEKGPALGQVHGSLQAIYAWYNTSRNAYLEQVKQYIEVIERQNKLMPMPNVNSEEIDAVQRAVEVSIQIMRASAEVEAKMRAGAADQQVDATRN